MFRTCQTVVELEHFDGNGLELRERVGREMRVTPQRLRRGCSIRIEDCPSMLKPVVLDLWPFLFRILWYLVCRLVMSDNSEIKNEEMQLKRV